MEQTINVFCKNNGQSVEMPVGSTAIEAYNAFGLDMPYGVTTGEQQVGKPAFPPFQGQRRGVSRRVRPFGHENLHALAFLRALQSR